MCVCAKHTCVCLKLCINVFMFKCIDACARVTIFFIYLHVHARVSELVCVSARACLYMHFVHTCVCVLARFM